jgi:hypothetical protein
VKNKILSFVIDISGNKKERIEIEDLMINVFTHILTMFINLEYLQLGPSLDWHQQLSFHISHPTISSSILLELHVYVASFTDCLYLLDGRFPQLHTFHVKISEISSNTLTINNKVNYF